MPRTRVFRTKFFRRLKTLVRQPIFWALTIFGNSIALIGAVILYSAEGLQQTPSLQFIDCLLWSFGVVTTVGYGEFVAHSFIGKITLLGLMMTGTLFVWTYMGFLVTGLIAPELASLEHDVHIVESQLRDLKTQPVRPSAGGPRA